MESFKKQVGTIGSMMEHKQTIELTEDDEPKIVSWEVGKSYPLKLTGKLVELTEDEDGVSGVFEIGEEKK